MATRQDVYDEMSREAESLFNDSNLVLTDAAEFAFECPNCGFTGEANKSEGGSVIQMKCASCGVNVASEGATEKQFAREYFGQNCVPAHVLPVSN